MSLDIFTLQMVASYTVVLIRVGYFVLLNYSYKSWSIIKTRDRFENCWSWRFQNTPYMWNLTKFWLMMKDEGWWFQAVGGFALWQTDICNCWVAFPTENNTKCPLSLSKAYYFLRGSLEGICSMVNLCNTILLCCPISQ